MSDLPLKDIHLPPEIGFWPIAPGWWFLFSLLLVVLGLVWWWRRYRQRQQLFKEARQLLLQIEQQVNADSREKLIQLSALLRRVALTLEPRDAVASLSGAAWLRYLDQDLSDAPFSQGAGRCLADVTYRPQAEPVDFAALSKISQQWLAVQSRKRGWW